MNLYDKIEQLLSIKAGEYEIHGYGFGGSVRLRLLPRDLRDIKRALAVVDLVKSQIEGVD